MRQLAQKGFPLAKVIGEPAQKDGHYYAVYEYAVGLRFNSESNLHVISMAQNLRRLHDSSRGIKIPGFRNWPTVYGYQPDIDRLALFDSDHGEEFLKPTWKIASALLQNRDVSVIPIHGDFRRDNIRFDQSGVTRVFDFGNSRNDYGEVDLAVTLRDIDDVAIDPKDFLKTYRDSGVGKASIVPEAICASSLVLSIQECLYLWRVGSQNPSTELKNALLRETKHLESQLAVLPQRLSLYGEIFSS
jgi:Ser/Thr protein kinase RdoA (MazF antagonist)